VSPSRPCWRPPGLAVSARAHAIEAIETERVEHVAFGPVMPAAQAPRQPVFRDSHMIWPRRDGRRRAERDDRTKPRESAVFARDNDRGPLLDHLGLAKARRKVADQHIADFRMMEKRHRVAVPLRCVISSYEIRRRSPPLAIVKRPKRKPPRTEAFFVYCLRPRVSARDGSPPRHVATAPTSAALRSRA
jgi:hypothetical protein